jgi:hypothetical protein
MPSPKTPALPQFVGIIRQICDRIAADFDAPDSDFAPIMVVLPGDGSDFRVFGLPGELLGGGEEGKDILADEIMVPIIDAVGAKMLAWTMSAWTLELEGMNEAAARRAVALAQAQGLSNHPNRVERVMVTAIDSHNVESWSAQIHRTAIAPPTLGEWEDFMRKFGDKATVEGRFLDPLQAALRDSSGKPDPDKLARILQAFNAL